MGKIRLAISNQKVASAILEGGDYFTIKMPERLSRDDPRAMVSRRKAGGVLDAPCIKCTCQHQFDRNGLVFCPDRDQEWVNPPASVQACYLFMPKAGHVQAAA